MKCPVCGRENREGASYCAWCAARVRPAPPSQSRVEGDGVEWAETPRSGSPTIKLVPQSSDVSERSEPAAEPAHAMEPLRAPLSRGEIIAGRYRISGIVEGGPSRNVYRALDLAICLNCGTESNMPGDEYCSECGHTLERRPAVTIVEQASRAPEHYDQHFTERELDYYVKHEVDEERGEVDSPAPAEAGLRITWGRATDKGQQREHNEDYAEGWIYARGARSFISLFAVADGVGGYDSGEIASRLAANTVRQSLSGSVWELAVGGEPPTEAGIEAALRRAVLAANQAVYEARAARGSQMGTTLTAALIVGACAYVANVGDSRTYHYGATGLRRVTKDHSLVQRLVDTGQIAPRDVYIHPQRNLIYQSIGDHSNIRPDTYRVPLEAGDRLLLCSDGLWEMVRDEGIEEVLLSEPDPQRACDRLVSDANLAGGDDNIAVIIARIAPA